MKDKTIISTIKRVLKTVIVEKRFETKDGETFAPISLIPIVLDEKKGVTQLYVIAHQVEAIQPGDSILFTCATMYFQKLVGHTEVEGEMKPVRKSVAVPVADLVIINPCEDYLHTYRVLKEAKFI